MQEVAIQGLTQDEMDFVYNVEVLGLPQRKAAVMAGMPLNKVTAAHVKQARATVRAEINGSAQITKDDIVTGMRDAIDRARILADPMTEIVGWEKIAKLLGYDAPQKVDINIVASIEVLKNNARRMTDAELAEAVGARGVIDGDFFEVTEG
ncbi:MAG: hypothetical protein KDA57_16175 [Planctomycetales bacterium]|nr:hypothetical protein [Planctomycetales bacterium]